MNAKIHGKDGFVQDISCCPELIYFRVAYHFLFPTEEKYEIHPA